MEINDSSPYEEDESGQNLLPEDLRQGKDDVISKTPMVKNVNLFNEGGDDICLGEEVRSQPTTESNRDCGFYRFYSS